MEMESGLSVTGSPGLAERRKHPRHRISANVQIDYRWGSVQATAANISNNGMEVRSSVDIRHDTQVSIAIWIPDKTVFYGTAIWSLRTFGDGRESYRIGFAVHGVFHEGTVKCSRSEIGRIIERVLSKYG